MYLFFVQVQHEIIAAWMYTANNQLGIFEMDHKPTNPLLANDSDDEDDTTTSARKSDMRHSDGETLQDVWLQYLTQRYRAVKYYSKEQVSLFTFSVFFRFFLLMYILKRTSLEHETFLNVQRV